MKQESNQLDGGYAPPTPAPLAAAGVRGEPLRGLPAASEAEKNYRYLKKNLA